MKLIIDIDKDYVKIINKNGASNYLEEVIKNNIPLDDMLDKLRAEIVELDYVEYDYEEYFKAVADAVKIIDKYRKG